MTSKKQPLFVGIPGDKKYTWVRIPEELESRYYELDKIIHDARDRYAEAMSALNDANDNMQEFIDSVRSKDAQDKNSDKDI